MRSSATTDVSGSIGAAGHLCAHIEIKRLFERALHLLHGRFGVQSAGVPLNVAKDLLDHQSIAMTSQIYTHLSDEAFTNASLKVLSFATESRKKTQKKVVSIR